MALVRQPQYDVRGNSEEGTRSSDGYVDTSTGEIFRGQRVGDAENGFEYTTVPTGQTWDKMNKSDPAGKNIYGSQGYAPEQYRSEGDESSGTSYSPSHVAGMTPSGDMQIAESMDRKGYTDVLAKYGIKPRYDPQYGYVIPSNVHNAVTQEYFKNAGLGQYQERDGVTGFIDKYAVPLMMAATGYGMAGGFGGAAAAAETGTAGLATAETAAAAGDAFLPGALSNPFLQAMPTVSSMAQSAATNAAMQLATTGTIDPEKIFTSVITGAIGSTAGNLAGNAAANALDSNLARSVVSGAVSGATQAGINGTDPMAAALASGAASGLGYAGKLNGIDIPQKSINAVVSSIATGAPLDKTLLSAVMSMGVGAATDAISSFSNTQAPAPVETRTPLSPDSSGLDVLEDQPVGTNETFYDEYGNRLDASGKPVYGSSLDVLTDPVSNDGTITADQGRTGDDARFYDEEGNALDASGEPVYGSHYDVLTDPVTNPVTDVVTSPVTTPVTSTVIPRNTSTTTGGGLSTISPSSSAQSTPTAQPIPWLTNPSQSGLLTVKKEPNMYSQLSDINSGIPHYAEAGSVYDPFAPLSSAINPKKVASQFVKDKPTLLAYKNYARQAASSPSLSHAPLKNLYQSIARGMAEGGLPSKYEEATPKGHKPEFITGVTGFYADGRGTGQSDDIPALLHDGDYVMDAETVSALGDGSSKAGREVLEKFRNQVPHESKTGGSVIPAKIADGEYVFPAAFVTALGKGENKRGSEILDGLREKLRAHKRKAPLDKIPPKAKSPLEYLKSKV